MQKMRIILLAEWLLTSHIL